LREYGWEIVRSLNAPFEILELGSGSAIKTRLLIEETLRVQRSLHYCPIDISPEALVDSSLALLAAHDGLTISAHASDYFTLLRERQLDIHAPVLALYLGSNIGNFEPAEARTLLEMLSAALHPGDGLLIGYDLKKDAAILEAAYDDPTGVTAAFNKNLLGRMNRELGANFDLASFGFRANYDRVRGAVDSFLVSAVAQVVTIGAIDLAVPFAAGEAVHTESSYKFTREEIVALGARCGYAENKTFTDAGGRYALSLLTVRR